MGRLSTRQKITIFSFISILLITLIIIFVYKKSSLINDNLSYNQVVGSKTEQTAPDIYKSAYNGKIITWQGKIAPYSQINGIKFCVIDKDHKNVDINKPCDWFWADSKNLDNADNIKINPNWDGNWVNYTLKFYNVSFDEKGDYSNKLYTIKGKVNGVDCDVDNKCIPNIDIINIEK